MSNQGLVGLRNIYNESGDPKDALLLRDAISEATEEEKKAILIVDKKDEQKEEKLNNEFEVSSEFKDHISLFQETAKKKSELEKEIQQLKKDFFIDYRKKFQDGEDNTLPQRNVLNRQLMEISAKDDDLEMMENEMADRLNELKYEALKIFEQAKSREELKQIKNKIDSAIVNPDLKHDLLNPYAIKIAEKYLNKIKSGEVAKEVVVDRSFLEQGEKTIREAKPLVSTDAAKDISKDQASNSTINIEDPKIDSSQSDSPAIIDPEKDGQSSNLLGEEYDVVTSKELTKAVSGEPDDDAVDRLKLNLKNSEDIKEEVKAENSVGIVEINPNGDISSQKTDENITKPPLTPDEDVNRESKEREDRINKIRENLKPVDLSNSNKSENNSEIGDVDISLSEEDKEPITDLSGQEILIDDTSGVKSIDKSASDGFEGAQSNMQKDVSSSEQVKKDFDLPQEEKKSNNPLKKIWDIFTKKKEDPDASDASQLNQEFLENTGQKK